MTTRTLRKIVHIDEVKCNGCGVCVPSCAEGAIQIIDGKARLVSEMYCDGLGACLGECPEDAIRIEEREAAEFDEEAVARHLAPAPAPAPMFEEHLQGGCPGSRMRQMQVQEVEEAPVQGSQKSRLSHWPVQLTLVPPFAPFLQGADLVLAADCAPFAYPNFHQDFLTDHALVIACPKLDDFQAHQKKLNDILRQADVKSLSVIHMEVPCCFGLVQMAQQAIRASGKNIPFRDITIGVGGEVQE